MILPRFSRDWSDHCWHMQSIHFCMIQVVRHLGLAESVRRVINYLYCCTKFHCIRCSTLDNMEVLTFLAFYLKMFVHRVSQTPLGLLHIFPLVAVRIRRKFTHCLLFILSLIYLFWSTMRELEHFCIINPWLLTVCFSLCVRVRVRVCVCLCACVHVCACVLELQTRLSCGRRTHQQRWLC